MLSFDEVAIIFLLYVEMTKKIFCYTLTNIILYSTRAYSVYLYLCTSIISMSTNLVVQNLLKNLQCYFLISRFTSLGCCHIERAQQNIYYYVVLNFVGVVCGIFLVYFSRFNQDQQKDNKKTKNCDGTRYAHCDMIISFSTTGIGFCSILWCTGFCFQIISFTCNLVCTINFVFYYVNDVLQFYAICERLHKMTTMLCFVVRQHFNISQIIPYVSKFVLLFTLLQIRDYM
eukprot:TRINITY_DN66246_c0_g1_i1.p1 TRINITY_DN66246_c0_g1~~TRINITY_DN66246_c0_g1_i1.p1  ORF type:complete len:244 (-),score=-17.76 TRINITY_DN66246_c0_g1_i1:135-824(-)